MPSLLRSFSTKEGVSTSPHKAVVATSHQAGGSMTRRRATKTLRGRHNEIQALVHSKTSTQGNYTLHSHSN
jgi:hypothetical protein